MPRWVKVTMMTGCLLLWTGVAVYGGGVVGFMQGFLYGRMLSAPTDAVSLSVALRSLREGRRDSGLKLLESHLDGYIASYGYYLRLGDSSFDIFDFAGHAPTFLSYVARYRAEYPPQARETDAAQRIHQILSKYQRDATAKQPKQTHNTD